MLVITAREQVSGQQQRGEKCGKMWKLAEICEKWWKDL